MRPDLNTSRFVLSLLAVTASLATATPLVAQDRFGAAVSLTGADEVVVLKPGAAIGPAAAVVFRMGADGMWRQTARLSKLTGGYPGEMLLPGLSAGGDILLLASGDPDGREAGHLYQRNGDNWLPGIRVPIDPTAVPPQAGLPSGGLDMPTLNRLMGPPERRVALSPDGTRLAVAGGALATGTVHVLARVNGTWTLEAALRADGDAGPAGFGSALALGDDRLLVGAPRQGPGGAVHLFELGASGWRSAMVFRADSTESGDRVAGRRPGCGARVRRLARVRP